MPHVVLDLLVGGMVLLSILAGLGVVRVLEGRLDPVDVDCLLDLLVEHDDLRLV